MCKLKYGEKLSSYILIVMLVILSNFVKEKRKGFYKEKSN